jgi:uncharacterized membrane protein
MMTYTESTPKVVRSPQRRRRWKERKPYGYPSNICINALGIEVRPRLRASFRLEMILLARTITKAPLLMSMGVMGMSSIPIILWVLGDRWLPPVVSICVLLQALAVLAVLWQGWGVRRTLRTMAIVLPVTWAIEWVGSSTGIPFGAYSYTDALHPQLAHVPLHIPFAWLMMLPPSWAIASAITRGRTGLIFVVISALAFTVWDLFLDPQMVAWGYWTWQEPGGYFGIPCTNYLGWFLSAALVTALVRPTDLPVRPLIATYAVTWILSGIGMFLFWNMPGPALCGALGMGIFLVAAICRHSEPRLAILRIRPTLP